MKLGKVYGLYFKDELIYIGSTSTNPNVRLKNHKYILINGLKKNFKIYKYLNEQNCKEEDLKIKILEKIRYEDRKDLLDLEGKYIKEYKDKIKNINIAGRDQYEYYQDNREIIQQYKATVVVCECGIHSTKAHIARHKKTDRHKKLINSK